MDKREQHQKLRNELYALMSLDDDWHLKPETETYKRIIKIGKLLNEDTLYVEKVSIDRKEYERLVSENLPFYLIAQQLNISDKSLYKWRKDNDLI